MIRAIIVGLGLIISIVSFSNGETGAGLLTIVLSLVLLFMGSEERKDSQAYYAWREHWRNKGGYK